VVEVVVVVRVVASSAVDVFLRQHFRMPDARCLATFISVCYARQQSS
jgi:hypothetical protein